MSLDWCLEWVGRVDAVFPAFIAKDFLPGFMHVQSRVPAVPSFELSVSMNKHVSRDANLDTIEKAMSGKIRQRPSQLINAEI